MDTAAQNVHLNVHGTKVMLNTNQGLCPESEKACDEVFWLASVHPNLEKEDLDDVAAAVRKVADAFIDKKEKGIPIDYATEADRALL